jgi:L-aspartate oxidase
LIIMIENRFLINFNIDNLEKERFDVIIIGGGISGFYTALQLPKELKVLVIAKENVENSNSALAQGGIAVSLGVHDSPQMHFDDTIFAGAGLCDEDAVWFLVNEARENIQSLVDYGVNFDRDSMDRLSLTREGAHSINRIIHSGDTTGWAILDILNKKIMESKNITFRTKYFAVDLLTHDNYCNGLILFDMNKQKFSIALSSVVVCATGGYGQIYASTTNPDVSTGDGAALAFRAGAELSNLEFIQFHPTVFYQEDIGVNDIKDKKSGFLISEALRGEGAILRNIQGSRFMDKYHELLELAPRDVVARAIFSEMNKTDSKFVYLDITHIEKEYLINRFPNIYKTLFDVGIDISKDLIPVSPAEHYCMGGIKTDTKGRTSITGFYVCGESASNGIHGANRLASNSLLEGLVFGRIIARDIILNKDTYLNRPIYDVFKYNELKQDLNIDYQVIRHDLKNIMSKYVGILRDEEGLVFANNKIDNYLKKIKDFCCFDLYSMEVRNMILIAKLVVESAIERKESRGAHYRIDYPNCDNAASKNQIIKRI